MGGTAVLVLAFRSNALCLLFVALPWWLILGTASLRMESLRLTHHTPPNTHSVMLLGQVSFALFGGGTNFQIFTRFMSRILPMIMGPTRILDAFIIRHVVIAQEDATTKAEKTKGTMEHKTAETTEKTTEETTGEKTEEAEEKTKENSLEKSEGEEAPANDTPCSKRTTVPGAAIIPLNDQASAASLTLAQPGSRSKTHDANKESFIKISTQKVSRAVRSRHSSARRDYYLLVPRWAVVVYCVPVFIFCVAVFIRLATWPDCAAGTDVCLVRTYPIFRGYTNEGCACNTIMFDQTGVLNGSCAEGTQDAALEKQLQATVASASHVYIAIFSVNFQCPHVAETVTKAWDKFDSIRVFIFNKGVSERIKETDPINALYYHAGMTKIRAALKTMKTWTNLCTCLYKVCVSLVLNYSGSTNCM